MAKKTDEKKIQEKLDWLRSKCRKLDQERAFQAGEAGDLKLIDAVNEEFRDVARALSVVETYMLPLEGTETE